MGEVPRLRYDGHVNWSIKQKYRAIQSKTNWYCKMKVKRGVNFVENNYFDYLKGYMDEDDMIKMREFIKIQIKIWASFILLIMVSKWQIKSRGYLLINYQPEYFVCFWRYRNVS